MSLPDVWYLCDEEDWKRLSALIYEEAGCIIELKIMALNKKMENLLMEVRTAERTKIDTTPLVEKYTEAMTQKYTLQSKEGRLNFINDMLTNCYNKRRKETEEVLPL